MTKLRTVHRCSSCGAVTPSWLGRCPECEEWGTIVDEVVTAASSQPPTHNGLIGGAGALAPAVPIGEVDLAEWSVRPTGLHELDRVLGGGLVPGSVTLLGGEPGAGKSTLVLQLLAALAASGSRCLLVSAEESAQQVRLRADRLSAIRPELHLASETLLPVILGHVAALEPDVLVVDSIQTIHDPDLGSAPGTVGQVRECAHRLVAEAKQRGLAVLLIGHVTKEGGLAGPRVLEHVVDTVLSLEGDRHHALRLLRAVKHRFGPTAELGVMEITGDGLSGVPDASALFLADRRPRLAGSVVVPTVEGQRPLLVEVQALTCATAVPQPRRSAQGIDHGRLALLLAVLERRAGIKLASQEVYVSTAGGVRVTEPGADLAIALAVTSSHTGNHVPDDMVVCGEVGLGGELRQAAHTERRLVEAARMGFTRALVPDTAPAPPFGITAVWASRLSQAIALADCGP